jgi:hypothetical protein
MENKDILTYLTLGHCEGSQKNSYYYNIRYCTAIIFVVWCCNQLIHVYVHVQKILAVMQPLHSWHSNDKMIILCKSPLLGIIQIKGLLFCDCSDISHLSLCWLAHNYEQEQKMTSVECKHPSGLCCPPVAKHSWTNSRITAGSKLNISETCSVFVIRAEVERN